MVDKRKGKSEKLLTEVELELMNIIWDKGTCTVRDVQEALPKTRDRAYTSVATIMKILEQKGALRSSKAQWPHSYEPLVSRVEYETRSLRHLKENVFKGNPSSLVMRLLDDTPMSEEELRSLRKLLDERLKQ